MCAVFQLASSTGIYYFGVWLFFFFFFLWIVSAWKYDLGIQSYKSVQYFLAFSHFCWVKFIETQFIFKLSYKCSWVISGCFFTPRNMLPDIYSAASFQSPIFILLKYLRKTKKPVQCAHREWLWKVRSGAEPVAEFIALSPFP